MGNDPEKELGVEYALRFGEIAVHKGFITLYQLKEALAEQLTSDQATAPRPRKLIGEILFEKGWMTLNQIETVLEQIFNNQHYDL